MDADTKGGLPQYSPLNNEPKSQRRSRIRRSRTAKLIALGSLVFVAYAQWTQLRQQTSKAGLLSIDRLQADLKTCEKLQHKPKDPSGPREKNARYIDGHKPTLIRNATVWVGEPAAGTSAKEANAGKGYGWVTSDILIGNGLIMQVEPNISIDGLPENTEIWEAEGRQLTAGIIDMHSHTGVYPLPTLVGGSDGNEMSNDITPFVRSIDALDPLDPQLQVIKSGGVTTSLVLPGSGNNIGGEAFAIKHAVGNKDGRSELGARDLLADPEANWRYMKMACGENAKRVYGSAGVDNGPFSRMGESWYFRHAFEQAKAQITAQDDWCSAASANGIESMNSYLPQELKWESLGAALRGQVHINTHCYTIADLEAFVDHTNEFEFPVRAFHHAHQTYLVPEILKRTWGNRAPAAALFADNMYYKVESYIGSEQAGKILYENDITPVYVSDNPVLNAQHVVFEAAKAYGYGLAYHAALASVTTAPAELLGMGERIGKIKSGFDADIVVWDSDPLSVGAAPIQIWIDGSAQYEDAFILDKPDSQPIVPNADLAAEIKEDAAIMHDVIFTGVSQIMISGSEKTFAINEHANVIVRGGKIVCTGACDAEMATTKHDEIIALKNGHITSPFVGFGSLIGLSEIEAESTTANGDESNEHFSRAIDGLQLGTKQLKATFAHGVTKAISAPGFHHGGHHGVSAGFSTGASHALEKGAVWADEVALHYTLTLAAKQGRTPSISTAIAELRGKLIKSGTFTDVIKDTYSEASFLREVMNGEMPLVITVNSADTIAALLRMKREVEAHIKSFSSKKAANIDLVLLGGAESHLVAKEIAASNVSVILAPLLEYSRFWDARRSLTGAPLTNGTAIDALLDAGVLTAVGTTPGESWEVRDMNLLAGIAYRNSGGRLSQSQALGLVGKNFEKILGVRTPEDEFVVFEGSPLEIGGRVKAVGSQGRVSIY
ncbi:amidohydrolase [Calycina marina]|uniref:Amidohydrolase n=1 Tax=Calycina marina TaxID=1763456 RepID=A0A9P7Z201_9HELO|nr:amidohydrolase [Calycina marina]